MSENIEVTFAGWFLDFLAIRRVVQKISEIAVDILNAASSGEVWTTFAWKCSKEEAQLMLNILHETSFEVSAEYDRDGYLVGTIDFEKFLEDL